MIADIGRRDREWSHVPVDNGEGIQVPRYRVGQEYRPHMDAFSDAFNQAEDKGGQRVATVLMYLTDVEEGSEAVFPYTRGEAPRGGRRVGGASAEGRRGGSPAPGTRFCSSRWTTRGRWTRRARTRGAR